MDIRFDFRSCTRLACRRFDDAPGLLRSSFAPLGLTTEREAYVFLGLAPQATFCRRSAAKRLRHFAAERFSPAGTKACSLGRKPQDLIGPTRREKPLQGRYQPHANRRACCSLLAIGEAQP